MTAALRFILGDQLSFDIATLRGLDRARDRVLMVEVAEETTYVPHHKQKLVFVLSAMRHFAEALRADGITVDYIRLDDPDNTGSFTGELARAVKRHAPAHVIVTEPGEWRVLAMMETWSEALGLPVLVREDDRFFATRGDFAAWAGERRSFRLETFYRVMRQRTGLLMDGGAPEGGRWNYDAENRKRLPDALEPPGRLRVTPDRITEAVIDLVRHRFAHHFGDLDGFGWAVTRTEALAALEHFIAAALPRFGDYQDAMRAGEPFLYHALLSPYLNAGLLGAREVCARAEEAYRLGRVPLNAAEGFIRQILG